MSEKTHNILQQVLARIPDVSAEPLYRRWQQAAAGYKQLCAVAAAVRMGLFDQLDEPRQPGKLASLLGTDSNLTADLCDLLVDMGLIAYQGSGLVNTPLGSTYLHSGSPWFQGAVIENIFSGFDLVCRKR